MVTNNPLVFAAIADPTRRAILDTPHGRERAAGEIAGLFPTSRPAISRHLRVLREAGLVVERRSAQSRLYSLNPAPLRDVDRWLERYRAFWTSRLQNLERVAENVRRSRPGVRTRASRQSCAVPHDSSPLTGAIA